MRKDVVDKAILLAILTRKKAEIATTKKRRLASEVLLPEMTNSMKTISRM